MRENYSFFVVWCPSRGLPTVRHDFDYQARSEAERLANANPGLDFYVLHAETLVRKVTTEVIKLQDQHPF